MSTGVPDLYVTPSTLEVDYEKNLTELYRAITDQDWETAIRVCEDDPVQAATWVVRHYEAEEDDDEDQKTEQEIMWRFLPIHSACARQPPAKVISALIRAYPDGAACVDDQGMYALHYACGNQASRDVIRQLLVNFPEAAKIEDPRGMLPIHYLACWGPASVAVIDMLLVANRNVADCKDADGKTPLDLAFEGDYPERDAVVAVLEKWLKASDYETKSLRSGASNASSRKSTLTSRSANTNRSTTSSRRSTVSRNSAAASASIRSKDSRRSNSSRKATTRAVPVVEEEKKEDESSKKAGSVHSDLSADRRVRAENERLMLAEIDKLRSELLDKNNEIDGLESKLKRQEDEISSSKLEIAEVHKKLEDNAQTLLLRDRELQESIEKTEKSQYELKELQISLGDLMEKHESLQKKTTGFNDRLGSVTLSLTSITDQHRILSQVMEERGKRTRDINETRNAKLRELLAIEEEIMEYESKVDTCIAKQNREIEAINAMVAAARD